MVYHLHRNNIVYVDLHGNVDGVKKTNAGRYLTQYVRNNQTQYK